jgi:type I restriction-modification system DNA methylase subunit
VERLAREAAEKEERLAREEAKKLERIAREAAEKEERLTETADRIAFYKLQEMEFMRLRDCDERDRERQSTLAARAKFFGDVLKNAMPKFPNDVADTPIFFEGVEKLLASFSVPTELQSKSLLPYLNDKVKSMLLRLD